MDMRFGMWNVRSLYRAGAQGLVSSEVEKYRMDLVEVQEVINTKKYHVFAPMGRFQLESIYLYFPPSSQLVYLCFCPVGLSLL